MFSWTKRMLNELFSIYCTTTLRCFRTWCAAATYVHNKSPFQSGCSGNAIYLMLFRGQITVYGHGSGERSYPLSMREEGDSSDDVVSIHHGYSSVNSAAMAGSRLLGMQSSEFRGADPGIRRGLPFALDSPTTHCIYTLSISRDESCGTEMMTALVPAITSVEALLIDQILYNGFSDGDGEPFQHETPDEEAAGPSSSPTTFDFLCGHRARGTRTCEPMTPRPSAAPVKPREVEAELRPGLSDQSATVYTRLLSASEEAMSDEELLTLLLSYNKSSASSPGRLAARLIARYETFGSVISARQEHMRAETDIDPELAAFLKVVRAAGSRLAREEISERPVLDAWDKLIVYLRSTMAHETVEQFRVLFLDRRNVLIADEVQHRGTIDHTPVYPREVAKRALELDASAIIMAHNHPSNHPAPSKPDIEMTNVIADTLKRLGIVLHDHIIVSRSGHSSFRAMGLLATDMKSLAPAKR